jgi:hypothetical protein
MRYRLKKAVLSLLKLLEDQGILVWHSAQVGEMAG